MTRALGDPARADGPGASLWSCEGSMGKVMARRSGGTQPSPSVAEVAPADSASQG
jgi:hypothetical protein